MYALKLLFSMSGRMSRMSYILTSFIAGILGSGLVLGIDLAAYANTGQTSGNVTWAIMLLSIYSQAAMLTKRIRDTGRSTSLVWVYYITLVVGFIVFFIGFISPIAFILGMVILCVPVIITLIAIFAGSAPIGNLNSHALDGLASSDPMSKSLDDAEFSADADAMIARALEMRKIEQQSANEDVLRPVTRAAASAHSASSGGFGRRAAPAFGNR